MERLSVDDIVKMVGGEVVCKGSINFGEDVTLDSRKVKNNDVFFAMSGTSFDGHDFVGAAVENGAGIVIVEKFLPDVKAYQIKVADTLKALYDMAISYKSRFDIPFIALTGSSGKTTTKDIIASVLSKKYNTFKTKENFNSITGVPLTIFNLRKENEIAVIEMGMDNLGQIDLMSSLVKPDIAIITNVGVAHMEKLKSRENILKAKCEIFKHLKEDGLKLINGDDELLSNVKIGKSIKIGINSDALDIKAENIYIKDTKIYFSIIYDNNTYEFSFKIPVEHNIYNSLFAIYLGFKYGMKKEEIQEGLDDFKPSKNRMEIIKLNKKVLINDTYNSNPIALKSTLDLLCNMAGDSRKIAIIGDMNELGEKSKELHYECGKYASSKNIDIILTYGDLSKYIGIGAMENGYNKEMLKHFTDKEELASYIEKIRQDKDYYLFKSSRGVKLEEVVEKIKQGGNF